MTSYYDFARNRKRDLLKEPVRTSRNGMAYYWGFPVHVTEFAGPDTIIMMRRLVIMHPLRHIELTSTTHDEWLEKAMAWIVADAHKKLDKISADLEKEKECPGEDSSSNTETATTSPASSEKFETTDWASIL